MRVSSRWVSICPSGRKQLKRLITEPKCDTVAKQTQITVLHVNVSTHHLCELLMWDLPVTSERVMDNNQRIGECTKSSSLSDEEYENEEKDTISDTANVQASFVTKTFIWIDWEWSWILTFSVFRSLTDGSAVFVDIVSLNRAWITSLNQTILPHRYFF